MNESQPDWLASGRGIVPRQCWSLATDAQLIGIELARESGHTLAADDAGGLYLLDRGGQVVTLSRGFGHMSALAISDTGDGGVVAIDGCTVCRFTRTLEVDWTLNLLDEILAVAIDPFGHYIAVSLANGTCHILGSEKQRISRFETIRPLSFLRFVVSEPKLVGAAEYGLFCCHTLNGEELWNEKLWSNVGQLCLTGNGKRIHLASFTYGIQSFRADGTSRGSFQLEGTPNDVSTSFAGKRISATTIEGHLYWLDGHGELVFATMLPEEGCRICCDPLGTGLTCGFLSGRIIRLEWENHAEAS